MARGIVADRGFAAGRGPRPRLFAHRLVLLLAAVPVHGVPGRACTRPTRDLTAAWQFPASQLVWGPGPRRRSWRKNFRVWDAHPGARSGIFRGSSKQAARTIRTATVNGQRPADLAHQGNGVLRPQGDSIADYQGEIAQTARPPRPRKR